MYKKQLILIIAVSFFLSLCNSFAARDYIVKQDLDGDGELLADPTVNKYKIDIDGDKKAELIKVMYGPGISDKFLEIEVYKEGRLISTLKGEFGIQSNYKIEDVDNDGRKDIIIWSAIWDPRLPGEEGVTEETYEGHSSLHRYIVATYKLLRGKYCLWEVYTTKKKYEPLCEEQPKE